MTSTPQPADELLPPGEAAALLGISPETLGRWARDGVVPSQRTRPGGHRRFRRSEIDKHIAAGRMEALRAAEAGQPAATTG